MPAIPRIEKVVMSELGGNIDIFVKNVGDATMKPGALTGKAQQNDGCVEGFQSYLGSLALAPGETVKTGYKWYIDSKDFTQSLSIKEFTEYGQDGTTYPVNSTITFKRGWFSVKLILS